MNLSEITIDEVRASDIYISKLLAVLNVPESLYEGNGKGGFFQRNRDNLDYFVKDVRPYFQQALEKCSTPKEKNLVKCIWDNIQRRVIGVLHPNLQIHSGFLREVISEEERRKKREENKADREMVTVICQAHDCRKSFQTWKTTKMRRFCKSSCQSRMRRHKKKNLTILENPYRVSI